MATVLLIVIYMAFISLGLPDSVLGTAWPMMHIDIDAPVNVAGVINMAVCVCTVIASVSSQKVIRKFGTYAVTVFSILLTITGLLLISTTQSFLFLVIFSLPLGLGGGAIDTALNNYVAKHYSAMQMNFLHAFWGIGTIIAPFLLSIYFDSGKTWRDGYHVLAAIQIAIFFIVLFTKRLWKNEERDRTQVDDMLDEDRKVYSIGQLLKVKGVIYSCLGFLFYSFESVSMLWMASYLVYGKGLNASLAASVSSMIYLGITAGRIASAFIVDRIQPKKMITISQIMILITVALLYFTRLEALIYVLVFVLGFSFGPIFPIMVKQTVSYFHPSYSVGIIGLQMSFGYIGGMTLPPLYGLISSVTSRQDLLPAYLFILVALHFFVITMKNRKCGK